MPSQNDSDDLNEMKHDSSTEEDNTVSFLLLRNEVSRLRKWRDRIEDPQFGLEHRIRTLEDFRLQTITSHKIMLQWFSIASGAFAITVDIIDHLFFKK